MGGLCLNRGEGFVELLRYSLSSFLDFEFQMFMRTQGTKIKNVMKLLRNRKETLSTQMARILKTFSTGSSS